MLRMNFFIATFSKQAELLLAIDQSRLDSLELVFNILLPAGGLLGWPIVAYLMDSFSHPVIFVVVVSIVTVFGILQ